MYSCAIFCRNQHLLIPKNFVLLGIQIKAVIVGFCKVFDQKFDSSAMRRSYFLRELRVLVSGIQNVRLHDILKKVEFPN